MAGNVRRLLQVLFWVMLNVTFIGCQNALITANQRILMEKQSLTLTCKYNGSGTETVVLWYNETVGNFLALKPNASISGTCNFLSNGPSFEAARVTYSCDSTSDIYTLTITEVHLEDAGLWSCTFQDPLTGSPAADINIEIQTATTSFRSTSTTSQPTTSPSNVTTKQNDTTTNCTTKCNETEEGNGLTDNYIIGIAVGCSCVFLLIFGGLVFGICRKKNEECSKHSGDFHGLELQSENTGTTLDRSHVRDQQDQLQSKNKEEKKHYSLDQSLSENINTDDKSPVTYKERL